MHAPVRQWGMSTNSRALGFAACAGAAALWGTGFYFGKIALRELTVPSFVLYRFLFAAIVMVPIFLRERPSFRRGDLRLLLLGALMGVPVQFLLQFHGLALTTLAHASLMGGTMPGIVAGGAALFLHERLDRTGWIAIAGSTAGACLIALNKSHSDAGTASWAGDGLVVASLLLAVVWIITNRRLLDRHSSAAVSSAGLLAGTVMLALWVLPADGLPPVHLSPVTWLSLLASGLLCTVSTTLLWNWSTTQVAASEAGVFLNMEPMMGSALSVWLFHERLGWTAWVGGSMIVLSALVLTTRSTTAVPRREMPLPGGV